MRKMNNAIHINPFADKCIHGVGGARFIDSLLKSPTCPNCNPQSPMMTTLACQISKHKLCTGEGNHIDNGDPTKCECPCHKR